MTTYPRYIPDDTPLGKPNCGVISTAMICGISHEEAWNRIAANRPHGSRGNWKGMTYDYERYKVMKDLGVVFEKLPLFNGTFAQWLKSEFYKRSATYELCVTGHAMTLHRGRLFDQNAAKNGLKVTESPDLRRRMSSTIEIISGSPLRDGLETKRHNRWL